MTLLAGQFDAWRFVFDPEWMLAVLLFGAGYLWAAHVMSAPLWRRACFLCGLLLVALALLSPIEHVALDAMLSFHLLQNVMLADWAPPLLVLGLTTAMAAVAERSAWVRAVTHPAFALPYWLAVWYIVHIPAVYGYGLDHRWALGIEHLLFLTAGLAFWWPVLVPERMQPMQEMFIAGWGGFPLIGTREQVVDGLIALARTGLDGVLLCWPRYQQGMREFRDVTYPLVRQAGLRDFV